jgi:hypothetical protein
VWGEARTGFDKGHRDTLDLLVVPGLDEGPMSLLAARTHGPHEEPPPLREGGSREDPMHAEARTSPGQRRLEKRGPQHLQALERANAVRLARAELKRRVADGGVSAAEVILSSPWEAESMTVSDLLTSQRRWGSTRCRKFLQCVPIPENKPIGTLTERQRHALAALLGDGDRPARGDAASEGAEALRPMLVGVA